MRRDSVLRALTRVGDGDAVTIRVTRENTLTGVLVCTLARGLGMRMRGYLAKAADRGRDGLFFVNTSSVHTFGMRFALDVVHLSRDGTVLRVVSSLLPRRLGPWVRGTRHIIELPSARGALELRAGDLIEIVPAKGSQRKEPLC